MFNIIYVSLLLFLFEVTTLDMKIYFNKISLLKIHHNDRKMSNLLNAVERFVFPYESWHYAANGCIQIKMTYLIKLADITQC